jgi:predicted RND superfamily exporter protein
MNSKEALFLLGLESKPLQAEVIEDAYEQVCFAIKDYALRNTVVQHLFFSRIDRLIRLEEAFAFLSKNQDYIKKDEQLKKQREVVESITLLQAKENLSNKSFLDFLRSYEQQMVACKLKLSTEKNALPIAIAMLQMLEIQRSYEIIYQDLMAMVPKEKWNETAVKIGEQVPSSTLIKLLKAESQSEINDISSDVEKELFFKEAARINKLEKLIHKEHE